MDTLDYLRLAGTHATSSAEGFSSSVSVNLVTNFTDEVFRKLLVGMCVAEDIAPIVWASPYKQYHFLLKDRHSDLYTSDAEVTFMLFDLNPYLESEFTSEEHFASVLEDIDIFSVSTKSLVVVGTFLKPYEAGHGLKETSGRLWQQIDRYNATLSEFAKSRTNVYIVDTNMLAHGLKFEQIRDLRNMYAFDMPFAQEFSARVCATWLTYIRARLGRTKKCVVVDLDHVLWGGILGEVGPVGIQVGTDYPGNAYRSFQQTLLDLYDRGIILAINSKNNLTDVKEVFEKNKHMILQERHFAAMYINWENKVDNIQAIAKELNIDASSMVFIDDDPLNRDLVQTLLPQVLVPNFSLPPEEYTRALLALNVFDPLSGSQEDKERNRMYAAEKLRNESVAGVADMGEYLRRLGIRVRVSHNDVVHLARASQLMLKTNQFNLTTRRYSEHELERFIAEGSVLYTAHVEDTFGQYGVTNVALLHVKDDSTALLDTFLMSCRVIGRGVEYALMDYIVEDLKKIGISKVVAQFIKTPKNAPAKDFLLVAGYAEVGQHERAATYELMVSTHTGHKAAIPKDTIAIDAN